MGPAVGFALGAGPTPGTLENEQRTLLQRPQAARLQPTGEVRPTIPGMPVPVFTGRGPGRSALHELVGTSPDLDTRASLHARATRYSFMNP